MSSKSPRRPALGERAPWQSQTGIAPRGRGRRGHRKSCSAGPRGCWRSGSNGVKTEKGRCLPSIRNNSSRGQGWEVRCPSCVPEGQSSERGASHKLVEPKEVGRAPRAPRSTAPGGFNLCAGKAMKAPALLLSHCPLGLSANAGPDARTGPVICALTALPTSTRALGTSLPFLVRWSHWNPLARFHRICKSLP